MRTTLTIDDSLLAEFRLLAARTHRSLSSVIQDALREALAARKAREGGRPVDLPVFGGGAGLQRGVDLDSMASLLDLMDESDAANGDDRLDGEPGARCQ